MATFAFPALGFDPAPGDPDRVAALADASTRAAGAIGLAAQRLTAAQRRPQWQGDAATSFDVEIGRLPADLDSATTAYGRAGRALRQYAEELRLAQAEARRLEEQARQVGADAPTSLLDDPATLFRSRIEAEEEHAEIVRTARRVAEHVDAAANRTSVLLLSTGATAPHQRPGVLARAATAVEGWIDDNVEALRGASVALKAVSTMAGLLAFVPAFTPVCAPLALGTAAAALGVDAALAAAGKGNWRRVAVEAVTTLVPGGRVLRVAGTPVSRTDRFLDAASQSARGVVRADVLAEEPDGSRPAGAPARGEGVHSTRVHADPNTARATPGSNRRRSVDGTSTDSANGRAT